MAVRINIPYRNPMDLLVETERKMEGIQSKELFNAARHQKLRERWCASMFAIGYLKHVKPCHVAVNEDRYREDVDFFIEVSNVDYGFQLAEVQRPERRRGQEYRELGNGGPICCHTSPVGAVARARTGLQTQWRRK